MIGVLIVTHGSIGESLLASAKQILDDEPPLTATLGVSRNDDPDDLILRASACSSSSTPATACWCSPTSSAPRRAT